jgi:thymidylate synthase (FAD)
MDVEYIAHMGDDKSVVNAARISFAMKEKDVLNERDESLIQFLARGNTSEEWEHLIEEVSLESNKDRVEFLLKETKNTPIHFTPFTHTAITVRETVPIFVARQRFKSVVGFSYNEISRRYVKKDPEFYYPDIWRKANPDKKQGSLNEPVEFVYDPIDYVNGVEYAKEKGATIPTNQAYEELLNSAMATYKAFLGSGVCPEQARMILPQSMMTSYYVTGSLAAFARIYNLRIRKDSQREIQILAEKIGKIIQPLYPVSWKALTQ